jgi:tripartite-type tricarboxylate transporter receptor subunit TctC
MQRIHRLLLAVAALAALGFVSAQADDYPAKSVRIVIPFAPGGINDLAARMVATHLTERLGKQFIPDNRSGAGGVVGMETVANAAPDGYTLLVASIANASHPWLYKLNYDPHKAFEPIALFVTSPNVLAVYPELPAKSVKELIALAKAKPGDLHYASGGAGGSLHLGMEYFKMVTGTDIVHVPFRGAGPGSIDVIAGNTKAIVGTASSLSGHVRSGKLRGLAVATKQRLEALPEVPTFIEAGLPEYQGGNWIGFAAPAGTPKAIVDRLSREIAAIQDNPEIQKTLRARGAEIERMNPAEFRAYMEAETAKWGRVIKQAGITAQ